MLAQPQLRFDLGKALGNAESQLFIGLEYQYWANKQGEDGLDENAVQLLLVWQF